MKRDNFFLKNSFLANFFDLSFKEDPFLLSFFKENVQNNENLKMISSCPPSKDLLARIRAWYLFYYLISQNIIKLWFFSEIVILEESVNELIMQKNISKRPESRNAYVNSHRILQDDHLQKNPAEKNNKSVSPSKLKKQNVFEIIPAEIFEDELENYLNHSIPTENNGYRDLFVSSAEEILKIKQNFCETNILELHHYRSDQKEGIAILYVNKVNEFFYHNKIIL